MFGTQTPIPAYARHPHGRPYSGSVLAIVASVILIGTVPARAISIRHDVPVAEYNALAELHPAAGFLAERGFGQSCSATLVAPDKVLTAAHCVDFNANGVPDVSANNLMFGTETNLPGFSNNISSIVVNPLWNGNPAHDLAVLTLDTPITDVTPARITDRDPQGLLATMVGYGIQGTGSNHPSFVFGANDKLAAQNIIDRVTNTVQTDFDSPSGNRSTYGTTSPLALEGTTAGGDSGGPVFAHFGGDALIVGVLNGGWNPFGRDSEYGDISEWTYVGTSSNLAFLAGQGILPAAEFDAADFNQDGNVDGDDFLIWQSSFQMDAQGDADADGDTDGDDFVIWQTQFGSAGGGAAVRAVPEPSGLVLFLLAGMLGLVAARRRHSLWLAVREPTPRQRSSDSPRSRSRVTLLHHGTGIATLVAAL